MPPDVDDLALMVRVHDLMAQAVKLLGGPDE